MTAIRQHQSKVNPIALAKMLKAMTEPAGVQEIHDESGLSPATIGDYLVALHKERLVYISGWEKDSKGRWSIRLWKLGDKEDARKPKPKSAVERQNACKARKLLRQTLEGVISNGNS